MIKIPENCRAVGGRSIEESYRNLIEWADTVEPPLAGGGFRLRDEWDEVRYYAGAKSPIYPVKFQVRLTGDEVIVSPGLLNRESPRMGIDRLDLLRRDFEMVRQPVRPRLRLLDKKEKDSEQGPGADGRSFVCLRILVDRERGEPAVEDRPRDWLLIVHRSTLPPGFHSGAMPEVDIEGYSACYWPIAVVYWTADGRRPTGARNCVNFDLHHSYYPPADDGAHGIHVCY